MATKGKLRSNEVSCDQSTTVPVDCRPKFIPVPETNIQVVNSNESLAAGLNALLLPGTGSGLAGHLQVVGLDCEVSFDFIDWYWSIISSCWGFAKWFRDTSVIRYSLVKTSRLIVSTIYSSVRYVCIQIARADNACLRNRGGWNFVREEARKSCVYQILNAIDRRTWGKCELVATTNPEHGWSEFWSLLAWFMQSVAWTRPRKQHCHCTHSCTLPYDLYDLEIKNALEKSACNDFRYGKATWIHFWKFTLSASICGITSRYFSCVCMSYRSRSHWGAVFIWPHIRGSIPAELLNQLTLDAKNSATVLRAR